MHSFEIASRIDGDYYAAKLHVTVIQRLTPDPPTTIDDGQEDTDLRRGHKFGQIGPKYDKSGTYYFT